MSVSVSKYILVDWLKLQWRIPKTMPTMPTMPTMRRTRVLAMGISSVLPLRIILPASPAHVREQSGKKFETSKVIEHLTDDFNEKLTTITSKSSVAIIDVKIRQAVSRRLKALKEHLRAYLTLEPLEIGNR